VNQLVIVGDSWSCGEWIHQRRFGEWIHQSDKSLKLNHPGMTEYLPYKTLNLSKGGASNWQSLYSMFNLMNQRQHTDGDYAIIVFQSDPTRSRQADQFDVDVKSFIKTADSLLNLYVKLTEIFYMKIAMFAKQFDVPIYISGGLSDVDESLFSLYNNKENIICTSWIKLLDQQHRPSIIPLQFDSDLFKTAKELDRLDLCDEIAEYNDNNFVEFTKVVGLDTFGPSFCDFHPSRQGHKIMAEHITNFIETQSNA